MAAKSPDQEEPLSDPASPQMVEEIKKDIETRHFKATKEWVDGELKKGLTFKYSEKQLWLDGALVYLVDHESYWNARRAKETINVGSSKRS